MCSIARPSGPSDPNSTGLAATLSLALDELAAQLACACASGADAGADATGPELADRLAGAWAMIAAADPEIAARTARYCH